MAELWTFLRGLFAISLGAALFFQPDKSLPMLTSFMGGFWITSGILSVRWGLKSDHSKLLTIIIGAVGILTGAATIGSRFILPWVNESLINILLGVVIVITGIMHVSGRMSVRHALLENRSRTGMLLGIFEIILGLVLIFSTYIGPVLYTICLIWALLSGAALMWDALQMRRENKAG